MPTASATRSTAPRSSTRLPATAAATWRLSFPTSPSSPWCRLSSPTLRHPRALRRRRCHRSRYRVHPSAARPMLTIGWAGVRLRPGDHRYECARRSPESRCPSPSFPDDGVAGHDLRRRQAVATPLAPGFGGKAPGTYCWGAGARRGDLFAETALPGGLPRSPLGHVDLDSRIRGATSRPCAPLRYRHERGEPPVLAGGRSGRRV